MYNPALNEHLFRISMPDILFINSFFIITTNYYPLIKWKVICGFSKCFDKPKIWRSPSSCWTIQSLQLKIVLNQYFFILQESNDEISIKVRSKGIKTFGAASEGLKTFCGSDNKALALFEVPKMPCKVSFKTPILKRTLVHLLGLKKRPSFRSRWINEA